MRFREAATKCPVCAPLLGRFPEAQNYRSERDLTLVLSSDYNDISEKHRPYYSVKMARSSLKTPAITMAWRLTMILHRNAVSFSTAIAIGITALVVAFAAIGSRVSVK